MSWADGPMTGLDTETTGVDVENDRIVTVSIGSFTPGNTSVNDTTWLIAVDIDIDPAATAIHGITTEYARKYGRPAAEALGEVADTLAHCWSSNVPLIGFNCVFDLSILDWEMRRWLGRPLTVHGPVIDGLVLDWHVDRYRPGSHKLADTCKHYGIELTVAHSSDADTLAAMRVAWKIAKRWPEIGSMSLPDLQVSQARWFEESQRSFANYLRGKVADKVRGEAAVLTGDEREVKLAELADLMFKADQVDADADSWPLRRVNTT